MNRVPEIPIPLRDHEHKLLILGDFGGWYCVHCKNGTDETGPWPNEVLCIKDQNNPLYKG